MWTGKGAVSTHTRTWLLITGIPLGFCGQSFLSLQSTGRSLIHYNQEISTPLGVHTITSTAYQKDHLGTRGSYKDGVKEDASV